MKILLVQTADGSKELDRVHLNGSGELEYATGASRDMFENLVKAMGITPAKAFEMREGWSNGYLRIIAA